MASTSKCGGDRTLGTDQSSPDGQPECPKNASAAFKKKWGAIASQIDPNALRRVDAHALTLLCTLLVGADELQCQLRDDPTNAAARRFFLQTTDRIIKLSAMFGLSPVDRMRLKIEKRDEPDAFQEWMNGANDE